MKIEGISVVIPSYNAASWLPVTIGKIEHALAKSEINIKKTEIVIVDDGSKDETEKVVKELSKKSITKIVYVKQKNQGRYLTRKNGVEKAKYDYIWFIDTRVHTAPNAIKYAVSEIKQNKDNAVWNAHVYVQKKGNVIARFMDAITYIGWRRYFSNPRRCSYGLEEFDYYPKGTTSFLVPKKVIQAAIDEFDQEERDLQKSSDDTHLIRIIARDWPINLSPQFSCKYHARNTFKAFIKHTFHRGQVFVDGFFRSGTRFYLPIVAFLVISVGALVSILIYPPIFVYLAIAFVTLWVLELLTALALGVPLADSLSLFILSPVFALFYGLGIWKAVIKKWLGKT